MTSVVRYLVFANIGVFLLWVIVLAIVILRREREQVQLKVKIPKSKKAEIYF